MYEVQLSPEAAREYARAERPLAKKLARCFAQLEAEPRRHNNAKRLTGQLEGYWRYRVGDWRVVYRVEEAVHRVWVMTIAHRSEVYE